MLKSKFYTDELAGAAGRAKIALGLYNANTIEVARLDSLIKANAVMTAAAIAQCKATGYAVAQSAEVLAAAADKQRIADVAAAKAAYEKAKPKAVEGGAAGTPCPYPTPNADDKGTRPTCNDELCCGAADKILLDGTKLTVETCQPLATTTFTFWPDLPTGATVAPKAQTWRFYCISGAKQIAAAATTAMAAAYLMA